MLPRDYKPATAPHGIMSTFPAGGREGQRSERAMSDNLSPLGGKQSFSRSTQSTSGDVSLTRIFHVATPKLSSNQGE